MLTVDEALTKIRALVSSSLDRAQRAKQLAVAIRSLGNYRWVESMTWVPSWFLFWLGAVPMRLHTRVSQ